MAKSDNNGFSAKGILVILAIFISVVFIFSLLLFLVIIFFFTNSNDEYEHSTLYQYQEIQPNTNHSTVGLVKLKQKLSAEDFLSYRLPTGNLAVISKFGDSKYHCTGYCSCMSNKEERRTTGILTRGLYVALTALSTSVAINIAEKAFEEQCRSYHEICGEDKVVSKVEECKKEKTRRIRKVKYVEKDLVWTENLKCEGHCLRRTGLKESGFFDDYEEWKSKNGKCEDLRQSGYVTVRFEKFMLVPEGWEKLSISQYKKLDQGSPPVIIKGVEALMERRAANEFVRLQLDVFCEQSSNGERFDRLFKQDRYDWFCSGWELISADYKAFETEEPMDHVKCVLVEPDSVRNNIESLNVPYEGRR